MHTYTKTEKNKAPGALPVFPLLSGRGVYPFSSLKSVPEKKGVQPPPLLFHKQTSELHDSCPLPLGERISRPLFVVVQKKQRSTGVELPWGVVIVVAAGRYRKFLLTLDFTVDALVGSGVGKVEAITEGVDLLEGTLDLVNESGRSSGLGGNGGSSRHVGDGVESQGSLQRSSHLGRM